jgi:branched-chain amino acid transport system permease protein
VSGLGSGAVLFLIASGLTLIFGALRVVNFAHGALYMLGAYAAFEFGNAIGTGNVSFWAVLLLSGLAIALLGVVVEVLVFRPIYSRTLLTQLLVTFALVLIIAGVQRKVWGAQGESTSGPPFLSGGVKMFGTQIPVYEFFFMGAAIVVGIGLWLLLYRTELGRMIRAAVSDRELLALTGVNVRLLYTGVFALGCFFAGLAGALVTLQGAVGPDLAVDSIIRAFVVIVLGGLGSLSGAFVASLLVGVAEALGIIWVPPASIAIVFAVLVIVLAGRPQGLFGARVSWTQERAGQAGPGTPISTRLAGFTALARRFRRPAAGSTSRWLWLLGLAGIVLVGLMPLIAGSTDVIRMQQALYLGLLALSLNLLVATTGLISFGQAMFFAVGAYTVAVPFQQLHWNPLLSFGLTPLTGAVAAFVIGLVVLRGRALYFSLLTLGVGQLIWATAHGWQRILGGTNGITAVFGPDWLNSFTHPNNLYWFVYGCVLVCTALLFAVTKSPFGDALRGIRENRRRAEFSGLAAKRYELGSFVIAGIFGSVAGGLFVVGETQITSEQIDWRRSALALIVCLIGGTQYFLGPFAGAIFYIFVFDWVIQKTVLYDTVLGLIVLGVALLMPTGLCGALEWLIERVLGLGALSRGRPVEPAQKLPDAEEPEAIHLPEVQPVSAAGAEGADRGSAEPLLAVKGISKHFGGLVAVDDVSFEVRPGRIHAIIGPNGAGKTTLFNVVTGMLRPSSGQVLLDGEDVTCRPAWQLVKRGLGRSFQQTNLFWALSTLDNVTLSHAASQGLTRRIVGVYPGAVRERARELLARVGLDGFPGVAANELSHGDQRSLELAAALAVDSRLLLLDEPTAGLSPRETQTAVSLIERIAREQGITVLFVEHDMEVVFGVADWITVLHRGAVLAEGTPEEVRRNSDVRAAYLGPEEDLEDEEVTTLA